MKPSEGKILDSIFTEVALNGIDIRKMDIQNNDDDFVYVLNKLCEKHHILAGTLFTREDIEELAESNAPPNLAAMIYMLKDDLEDKEQVEFVQFYSPEVSPEIARKTLRNIANMLHDNYAIDNIADAIEPTIPKPPIIIPSKNRIDPPMVFEHIAEKQKYMEMALSAKDTAQLRSQLQQHLAGIRAEIDNHKAHKREDLMVNPAGRRSFKIQLTRVDDGKAAIVEIAKERPNEYDEARLQDLAGIMIPYMADHGLYKAERILFDGWHIMVRGENAYGLAREGIKYCNERDHPALSKAGSFVSALSPPTAKAPPQVEFNDPMEDFIAKVAFLAIKTNHTELLASATTLNEQGIQLQKEVVGIVKSYLAKQGAAGIDTIDELKAAGLSKDYMKHYHGIMKHFAQMDSPPKYVTGSLIQQVTVIMLKDLKTLEKGPRAEGHGSGHVMA